MTAIYCVGIVSYWNIWKRRLVGGGGALSIIVIMNVNTPTMNSLRRSKARSYNRSHLCPRPTAILKFLSLSSLLWIWLLPFLLFSASTNDEKKNIQLGRPKQDDPQLLADFEEKTPIGMSDNALFPCHLLLSCIRKCPHTLALSYLIMLPLQI